MSFRKRILIYSVLSLYLKNIRVFRKDEKISMKSSYLSFSEQSHVLETRSKTGKQISISEALQASRAPFVWPLPASSGIPPKKNVLHDGYNVAQLAYAKTLKEIWLHQKGAEGKEDRSLKDIIPPLRIIRLDETDSWQRGRTSLIAADVCGNKGYVKNKEGEYWEKIGELFIENICELLDIDLDILWQPVNMTRGYKGKGCIAEYIIAQLNLLKEASQSDEMKNSAVIVGIARALAQLIGDVGAENRIARQINKRLYLQRFPESKLVSALARSNPLLKFLHNELNLHDTAVLIIRRANRAEIGHVEMWELLKKKLLIELKSLSPDMYATSDGESFDKTHSFGMYNSEFMGSTLVDGELSHDADSGINEVKIEIEQIGDAFPAFCVLTDNYAIREAQKHDEEMMGQNPLELKEYMRSALAQWHRKKEQDGMHSALEEQSRVEDPDEMIERLVGMLEQADITILRKAENMIQYNDLAEKSFRPGFIPHFISMERLLHLDESAVPEEGTTTREGDDSLSFYPLLLSTHKYGKYYPLFRSFKDHVYGGNLWMKAKGPVFAALDYDRLGLHGFRDAYEGNPAYGDVVFVLDKSQLEGSVIYTNKCTGRSYTNLRAFFYDLLLPYSTDVYGRPFSDKELLTDMFETSTKKKEKMNGCMKYLEVQIYKDVPINRTYVKEVIFNGSVCDIHRQAIIDQIRGVDSENDDEAPPPPMKVCTMAGVDAFLTLFRELGVEEACVFRTALIYIRRNFSKEEFKKDLLNKYKDIDSRLYGEAIEAAYEQLKTDWNDALVTLEEV